MMIVVKKPGKDKEEFEDMKKAVRYIIEEEKNAGK